MRLDSQSSDEPTPPNPHGDDADFLDPRSNARFIPLDPQVNFYQDGKAHMSDLFYEPDDPAREEPEVVDTSMIEEWSDPKLDAVLEKAGMKKKPTRLRRFLRKLKING
jgi:hypothetical protein